MAKTLTEVAEELYENEFDSADEFDVAVLTSQLEAKLGKLNVILHEEFCPDEDGFTINIEAAEILKELYLKDFYMRKSLAALRGIIDNTVTSVLSVKEGDTTITRANKSEIAKTLRAYSEAHQQELEALAARYQYYRINPRQVTGLEDC